MTVAASSQITFPTYGTLFLESLKQLQKGSLTFKTPCGQSLYFKSPEPEPHVTLEIKNWSTIKRMLREGDIGFAQDYFKGIWTTDHLPNLLTIGVWNEQALRKYVFVKGFKQIFYRLCHLLRSNSKKGSQRNIQAHYDLSNDFFRLWLDETMTYSSAFFAGDYTLTLAQAQQHKYQRLLDQLDLPIGSHLLEIGCGWGGFMKQATQQGYQVTGLTISKQQYDYLCEDQLSSQADLKFLDYRDITGIYDAIVSIEMFEAVGEKYWPHYFNKIKTCLKPHGKSLIQTILIDHSFFKKYRKRSDFIQLFSFPGGLLPSEITFKRAAAQAGLKVTDVYNFGADYAETLQRWRETFLHQKEAVLDLGFSHEFINKWHYYLSYCSAGFKSGRISVAQIELQHA